MYNFGWYASGYRGIATLAPYAPIRSQQRQKQRKAKIPHTHWLPCQMVSSKPFGFAAAVPHGDRNFLLRSILRLARAAGASQSSWRYAKFILQFVWVMRYSCCCLRLSSAILLSWICQLHVLSSTGWFAARCLLLDRLGRRRRPVASNRPRRRRHRPRWPCLGVRLHWYLVSGGDSTPLFSPFFHSGPDGRPTLPRRPPRLPPPPPPTPRCERDTPHPR